MKKLLVLLVIFLFGLSFIYGCGKKEVPEDTGQTTSESQQAVETDSVSPEATATDTTVTDSTEVQQDSI